MQVHGIPRKVHMDYIRRTNDDEPTALHSLALHMNLFLCDRDLEVLGFAKNSRTNIVFVLAGVGIQGGFAFHRILELIIFEKRGNDLCADVNGAADQEQRQKHFYGAHLPAPQEASTLALLVRLLQNSLKILNYGGDANILGLASRALNYFYPIFGNLFTHIYPKGNAH